MSTKFAAIVGAAGLLVALGGTAQAQQAPAGLYASGSAGMLLLDDQNVSQQGQSGTGEFNPGFALGGALGYRLGNGLRFEGELGYGRVGVDQFSGGGQTGIFNDVKLNLFSATANAFYDFDTGSNFTPYVGAGVGVVHTRQSSGSVTIPGQGVSAVSKNDSTDLTVLGEAGVAMRINDQWDLVPAYRFQWVDSKVAGGDESFAHTIKLGLRYSFGG